MIESQEAMIESMTAALEQGTLTAGQLRQGIADVLGCNGQKRQDILYLQAASSSPAAQVVGMTRIEDGQVCSGPTDPDDWPYQSVLDAVRDGWRIISFPNMALLTVDDEEFHGLGYEFILERWR